MTSRRASKLLISFEMATNKPLVYVLALTSPLQIGHGFFRAGKILLH